MKPFFMLDEESLAEMGWLNPLMRFCSIIGLTCFLIEHAVIRTAYTGCVIMSINFKKVLVLGSNSFTGSHLISCLLDNTEAEIVGISRSAEYNPVFLPYRYLKNVPARFRFCRIDLNNDFAEVARLCDEFHPEIVVNYAAQGEVRNSWNWPEQWYQTNCLAVVRVSEFLKT
ncbi:MAG: NAD-dependent epimerase/dehydratase family protein, partial [Kiritimatiellae bacterium]|nr:NAD-dependent epimerase/dehydratase family protein [Kiritimatiellia bacterium]